LPFVVDFFEPRIGKKNWQKLMAHMPIKNPKIITQCHDKWDRLMKKYSQEKATKRVTSAETISWIWFDMRNLNP
jgi:hypothetical protein